MNDTSTSPLLKLEDLDVRFETSNETVYAVNGINLSLESGETVGIVGESGSGKSVTALSILRLLDDVATSAGNIWFDGTNLIDLSEDAMQPLRGDRISLINQDPGSSLNPVLPVGDQISETVRTHRSIPGEDISVLEQSIIGNLLRPRDSFTKFEQAWDKTVELFDRVGIPLPEQRALEYPHEFSGGMKQRALIAMAISCQPDLLIADEPTTALDVTIEAQILELLNEIQREFGTAMLLITHDMGVIREICDRVAVMYAGNLVEKAPTEELFESPKHPYTKALLNSIPKLDGQSALDPLPGQVPDLTQPPKGCPFAARCPHTNKACFDQFPPEYPVHKDDDPVPVVSPDKCDSSSRIAPDTQVNHEGTHTVNCVLYSDADKLAAQTDSQTEHHQESDV